MHAQGSQNARKGRPKYRRICAIISFRVCLIKSAFPYRFIFFITTLSYSRIQISNLIRLLYLLAFLISLPVSVRLTNVTHCPDLCTVSFLSHSLSSIFVAVMYPSVWIYLVKLTCSFSSSHQSVNQTRAHN